MENLWLVLICSSATLFLFFFRAKHKPEMLPRDEEPTRTQVQITPAVPQSYDERIAGQGAAVLGTWHAGHRLTDAKQREEFESTIRILAKASELVEKSGVREAVCDLFRAMWDWPKGTQREHGRKMPFPIFGLDGSVEIPDIGRSKWIAFDWQGSRIRLQLDIDTVGDEKLGDLTVSFNNIEVMAFEVAFDANGRKSAIPRSFVPVPGGVSAFSAGPWMEQIHDLAGLLCIPGSQQRCNYEYQDLLE